MNIFLILFLFECSKYEHCQGQWISGLTLPGLFVLVKLGLEFPKINCQ